jgi:hypothetical protein
MVLLDGLPHDAPLDPALAAAFWNVVIDGVRSGDFGFASAGSRPCR